MAVYADGALVASNAAVTTAQNYTGYWRIGYDKLTGWPGATANRYFTGEPRLAGAWRPTLFPARGQIASGP